MKVLVAGVGNLLRGDDGFGVAVARYLEEEGGLPAGVRVLETGIGGMCVLHELMDGYEGLIVVDAVDRGEAPGTVFVLEPCLPDGHQMSSQAWQGLFSNLHLAEPFRIMTLAQGIGVLPGFVRLVGCQPECVEDFAMELSTCVAAAVPVAVRQVHKLLKRE